MSSAALARVNAAVDELCAAGHAQACFDADGVLWREDVGNDYFASCLERHLLRPKQEAVALEALEAWRRGELTDGEEGRLAALAVQVLQGLREQFVASDCAAFVRQRFPPFLIPEIRAWIQRLQTAGIACWVVSGSPVWGVRAGAELVGIPAERVLAVSTVACNGVLTPNLANPFPFGGGKAEAIRALLPEPPALAFGNTVYDVPMLELATSLAVAVEPDADLRSIAGERGWAVLEKLS